jgi:hypothetical protein
MVLDKSNDIYAVKPITEENYDHIIEFRFKIAHIFVSSISNSFMPIADLIIRLLDGKSFKFLSMKRIKHIDIIDMHMNGMEIKLN